MAVTGSSLEQHTSSSITELASWIDSIMITEGKRFLSEVPRASHLTDESPLDINYYVRHRIEAIWRIWLTARTDALSLVHMLNEDYDAARPWATYIAEELDHDTMFLDDLAQHGITADQVREIGPFTSTTKMVSNIEKKIEEMGSLPAVAYSLFVEWNADRFSARAVNKAEAFLSPSHIAGAKRHAEFDIQESHYPMILEISGRLLSKDTSRISNLEHLVKEIAADFRAYFTELDIAARNTNFILAEAA